MRKKQWVMKLKGTRDCTEQDGSPSPEGECVWEREREREREREESCVCVNRMRDRYTVFVGGT